MSGPRLQADRKRGVHRHLLDSLKSAGKRYRKQLERCRARCSEKAVHDLRVEIRRALALVEMIGVFVPARRVKRALKLLKGRLDVFDDLRDTQVQAVRLRPLAGRSAGARSYRKHLLAHESRCIRKIRKAVKGFRPARVRKRLEGFRAEIRRRHARGLEATDGAQVRKAVLRAFAEVSRRNRRVRTTDTSTIHRARIAFKKYRYMIETLAPCLQGASLRDLQAMHDHQTLMGDVQDLEVLMAGIRRFLRKRPREAEAVRPLLERLEVQRQMAVAAFLKKADRLSDFAPPRFLESKNLSSSL
jgi:CHAD domain-containing protein